MSIGTRAGPAHAEGTAEATDERIARLREQVPGMHLMDYRAVLVHAADFTEAVDWLQIKKRTRI